MQKYLFRYISFETFVGLVQKKALTFVSPTVWDDPKESDPFFQLLGKIEDKNLRIMLYAIYQKTFCQCWSKAVESDAMWRIYAYGNRAIQIKVPEKNLQLLPNVDLIPVVYSDKFDFDLDSKGHKDSFLRSLAIKRRAFQHEKEVRLINFYHFTDEDDAIKHVKATLAIHDHPQMVEIIESLYPGLSMEEQVEKLTTLVNAGNNRKTTIDIPFVDIPNFIQGVKVHPLAPNWYVDIVGEYCKRNDIPFDGKSTLYSDD